MPTIFMAPQLFFMNELRVTNHNGVLFNCNHGHCMFQDMAGVIAHLCFSTHRPLFASIAVNYIHRLKMIAICMDHSYQ